MTTENMRFLSVEQALADAAYFQVEFAKSYGLPSTTKNVIVGGSYSGALSAFYRIKYPDLVHLSYASSGVVHAVEDFDMYFVTVRNDTKPYVNCEDYVVSMTEKVAKMLQNPTDRATLLKTFDLCGYTNDDTDVWYAISGALEGAAQYGMIEGACEVITSESDPVAGYAKFFLQSANAYGMGDGCVPLDWVTDLQNTTWDNIEIGGRSWFWQKCTEFGFFKTPNKSGIFSPSADLEYHLDACRAIFGRPLEPNTDWINISYGGDHPHGRRIVYANGSVDPWHNLGVLSSLSSSQIAVFIDGTSHCQDLDTPSSTDPKPLHDAHILIESLIAKWLQEE
jgi:thymus-specific serine protease